MRILQRVICGILFALAVSAAVPSAAQRVQFPSYVGDAPPYSSPAAATLDGSIQAAPQWDPYSQPGAQPGYYPPAAGGAYCDPLMAPQQPTAAAYQRFLQRVRFRHTWLHGDDFDELDINTTELEGTFALPFFYHANPLLVTPGFAVHWTDGPDSTTGADLPSRLYDAFLDLGWQPQITPWLGADVGFRAGVYSDFDHFEEEAIRFLGRGFAVFTYSPAVQVRAGVIYLDRVGTKILPAGGIVWTPDPDTRWDILFPNPKFSQRLYTIQNTDLWWYVAGEFGGGSWQIDRLGGGIDEVEYRDIRVILGMEWFNITGLKGNFEVGYVFERELEYRSGVGNFDPSETIMLRGGISY